MLSRLFRNGATALSLVVAAATSAPSMAQSFPDRPLKLIVPFAAGGGTDVVGRGIAVALGSELGQPVIVDNRGGAGTAIGSDAVAKSPPDGYTMLLNGGSLSYLHAFVAKLPFDTEKDFRRISTVSEQPFVLTVSKSLPVRSVAEFVALAKSKPKTLNFVSAGVGSTTHMESELLWREMGVSLIHVPYRGTAPAVADLLAGHVNVMYTTLAAAAELIRTDKIKALAVSSATRSNAFPDIPTIGEALRNKFSQASTLSLFVPAATPTPVAERLFAATRAALADPALVSRFKEQGLTPISSKTLADAEAHQKAEMARWGAIAKALDIKPE
ncbi:Bug family tripartite tricarboxylate transporter substrate binding protein [Ottowia thiooxydans]|uniref:Bug family tripartite tricarboxylate transporter substrate binding protein n=1 Tax=Ottowia thiooxydans TaxID=219182 RepID=UPI000491F02B|nr:tripartite tricarboxylate transporter substrate binding protein [Ottowia thiooxydans]